MFILTFYLLILMKSVYSGVAPKLTRFHNENIQPIDSSFVLNCAAYMGTHPLKFQWFKNGLIIDERSMQSNRIQIETKHEYSLLKISEIKLNDSGNYSCTVINDHGFDTQWSLLQVQGLKLFLFICS
ncbi:Immunoglobulin I-set domain containing protein [Euroglyphus maynei]|uniref:Immunoglobulin I-set domain containing protein n=1 Tax=Euroglyphus maynei TaxID=6958 RepID=A0A1Y3BDG9_EURMA|nr:Immunoglobulin I-set domain containing protein [Euroglyphus maynei]